MKIIILTAIAMIAFAANSVLCRLALEGQHIDAASFTSIRLAAGTVALLGILLLRWPSFVIRRPNWMTIGSLFAYMACFSFSYQYLDTGSGALILFGAVQLTMISAALLAGEKLSLMSSSGLCVAVGGLLVLLFPGIAVPNPLGAMLMGIAGIAWGFYSLGGRGATDPTAATAANFLYALPIALALSILSFGSAAIEPYGVALAIVSGAITSGLGYAVWYQALPLLSATRAASVQLSVPAIAAIGGVLILSEPVTLRLVVATILLIGGISLVLWNRSMKSVR
ncbi:MAG: DMT family transporter [Parvibaculum sp.]